MKKQIEFKRTEIEVIPEEWEFKELGEVCQLVKKQYNPSKKDIRAYIGLEHIEQQNLRLINIGSTEDIDSNKFEFKAGQILFGKLRPYFRKVYIPKFDGVCSTDIWVIDSKGQFDNGFLFYFLADQRIINEASNSSEGTRMPRARWDYLSRLKFAFPSIGEQRAIASILISLDDKIALNRSMNSTLEAIGQALFKRWFVDFEFPDGEGKPYRSSGGEMVETELGEVPRGWGVDLITEVAEVVDCLHIKKPTQTEKGSILLQLYNIGEYGLLDFKELYYVSQEDYKVWTKNIVIKEGDCILTNAGLAGAIAQIPYGYEVGLGRNITAVRPNKITPAYLIRYLFSEYGKKEIQKNLDVGTIFNSLNVKGIRKLKMLIPDPKIISKFEVLARPLRKAMEKNVYENLCLSELRDALLPKLMSGEIRVSTNSNLNNENK